MFGADQYVTQEKTNMLLGIVVKNEVGFGRLC